MPKITPDTLQHHIDLTMLAVKQMNNNLLSIQQNSQADILNAIKTLKTELKPEPKSDVEKYGVIWGAVIGIVSAGITSLLNHLFSKSREKKQKEKELEFKQIDISEKRQEILMNIYAEAHRFQSSFIRVTRSYYRLRIRHSFLQARIRILTPQQQAQRQEYTEQLELIKTSIGERNNGILEELKHLTAELAKYKFLKNGGTEVTPILDEISKGINFNIADFSYLTTAPEMDALYYAEKRRFLNYWRTDIKIRTETALSHVLANT